MTTRLDIKESDGIPLVAQRRAPARGVVIDGCDLSAHREDEDCRGTHWDSDPLARALSLARLLEPMRVWEGDASFVVGIIDGPVDLAHPAFARACTGAVAPERQIQCHTQSGGDCGHGTAMAGILFADRAMRAPGICPRCSFLYFPIFDDSDNSHYVTPRQLAHAITATVDAGVRIINLSLAITTPGIRVYRELDDACAYARNRGVLLVCAAGNQGRLGPVPLATNPWVIPIAAVDNQARLLADSNWGPSVGARGFGAPGDDIPTTFPNARFASVSGTSAATAIATGAIALVWSRHPHLSADRIKRYAMQSAFRSPRSLVPRLLNASAFWKLCQQDVQQGETPMNADSDQAVARAIQDPAVSSHRRGMAASLSTSRAPAGLTTAARGGIVSQGADCATCAAGGGDAAGPPNFVYAIGTVRYRFPNPGVEKEFDQQIATANTTDLTNEQARYRVLREHRYLANEVCWSLTVENVDAYILVPRDEAILELLIEAAEPVGRERADVDVIIGQRGPLAPPEMCNGLVAPIVLVDQLYSFGTPELIGAIVRPAAAVMAEDAFRAAASDLFERITQLADNVGATDEHRALNYLSVRYPQIYTHTGDQYANNFDLSQVEVIPSRLSGTRKLVDVLLSYRHRTTDVTDKYYVRVDVTDKYPFLDKKLHRFYDR